MKIEGKEFGPGKPMIIAELSCNHAGYLEVALALIRAAHSAGADAVKFQAYVPGDLTAPIDSQPYKINWLGESRALHDLYIEAQTPTAWLPDLYREARRLGLIPITSPFHPEVLPILEELETPIYKIASPEVEYHDLLHAVLETGKPVLMSDGLGGEEFEAAMGIIPDAVRMVCVSKYPAKVDDYAFPRTLTLWGLSDHSVNHVTWVSAAALGASFIEAHLVFAAHHYPSDRQPLDRDHSFRPSKFAFAAHSARLAARLGHRRFSDKPLSGAQFRRRWTYTKDMAAGAIIARGDITPLRCAQGLPASISPTVVVGKRLRSRRRMYDPVTILDV